MNNKKINIPSEVAYVFAIITLAFAVAMITMTGFGVSMVVAPAVSYTHLRAHETRV